MDAIDIEQNNTLESNESFKLALEEPNLSNKSSGTVVFHDFTEDNSVIAECAIKAIDCATPVAEIRTEEKEKLSPTTTVITGGDSCRNVYSSPMCESSSKQIDASKWSTPLKESNKHKRLRASSFSELLASIEPGNRSIAKEDYEWALPFIYAIGTLLYAVLYVLIFRPVTCFLFSTYSLRHKIRGYLILPFENMLKEMFVRSFVVEIKEDSSTVINPRENCVVICNHQSLLDHFALNYLSTTCQLDASCFFYAYKHCSRLLSNRSLLSLFFKKYNWIVPKEYLPEVFAPVLESPSRNYGGKWVCLFPEVQMFTQTDLHSQRQVCISNGCKPLSNILYPRYNSFFDCVEFLRDCDFTSILDVTISYFNIRDPDNVYRGVPTYLDIILGIQNWKVIINVKKIPMSSISYKEKRVTRWLEKQWYEKDSRITEMKTPNINVRIY